jgi:hypothetical protein
MMKQMKMYKRTNLSLVRGVQSCINAFYCLFVHKKNIVFNLNRKTLIFIKLHALFFLFKLLDLLVCAF